MSDVFDYLARLFGGMVFWVVVLPWQQGVRVRAGRHVRVLRAGVYLKIPVLDAVNVESVRRRNSLLPTQTLSTADGHTVTVGAVVGYAIGDVERLYRSLHHAEDTIIQTAQGAIAAAVFGRRRAEIEPGHLGEVLTYELRSEFRSFGLTEVSVRITDFAYVRAIRLMQEGRWFHGGVLDTQPGSRSAR